MSPRDVFSGGSIRVILPFLTPVVKEELHLHGDVGMVKGAFLLEWRQF